MPHRLPPGLARHLRSRIEIPGCTRLVDVFNLQTTIITDLTDNGWSSILFDTHAAHPQNRRFLLYKYHRKFYGQNGAGGI